MLDETRRPAVLQVSHLSAFYGQAQALFDVSLELAQGEWVVLQGLNGAGKSTLLKAVMGLEVRSTGAVHAGLGPQAGATVGPPAPSLLDVTRWPTHRRARAGLGYVPEDRRLFTALSVQENLRIAAQAQGAALIEVEARVLDLFPVLKTMRSRRAAQMSGGEQQMLAIARTLMTEPTILLLDEPCEGISPVLVEAIRDALLALQQSGMSLLVAEQNQLLAASADRVVTLVAGTVRGS